MFPSLFNNTQEKTWLLMYSPLCSSAYTLIHSIGSSPCLSGCLQLLATPVSQETLASPAFLEGCAACFQHVSIVALSHFPHKNSRWTPGHVMQTPTTVHTSCFLKVGLIHFCLPSDTEHRVLHMVRLNTGWTNSFSLEIHSVKNVLDTSTLLQ